MNNQVEIYFLRHTEPCIEAGICYGQLDCDVTSDYAIQFPKISRYFKDKKINVIYSSPLHRCVKLAEDIATLHHVAPVIYKENFKEIHFGDWEGIKWDDIPRIKIDEWNHNRLHFQFPNGETPWAFEQRVLKEYSSLLRAISHNDEKKRTVLVVAHAGVIRTILANILSLSLSDSLNIKLDKPSISLCSFNDGGLESHLTNINLNIGQAE